MKRREQPEGYHLDLGFGDAADPEAAIQMSANFVPTFALPEAKENWREGVDLVKTFLTPRDVYSPGGNLVVVDEYGTPLQEPWLYVSPDCPNVIREFNNYRAAEARPERNPREASKGWDDHALDAIRYALMHIFRFGCTGKLADVYNASDFDDKLEGQLFSESADSGYFSTTDLNDF
jgi:hypothetical protein